jgi:hypothetical protein
MKALAVAALFAFLPGLAEGADPPPRYRMELITIADAKPPEEMVVVLFAQGGTAFKTLHGLQQFVNSLPQGATARMVAWMRSQERDCRNIVSFDGTDRGFSSLLSGAQG